jgi:cytochrome c peroxidase
VGDRAQGRRRALSRAALLLLLAAALGAAAAPKKTDDLRARETLGKLLFFDARLSGDKTVSCSTCHDPAKGWTDRKDIAVGIKGRKGRRNSQTLLNVEGNYGETLFWDGRAKSLEEQALVPLSNPDEMGSSPERAAKDIGRVAGYRPLFAAAFGDDKITGERIAGALAAFQRTLVTKDSAFDRWEAGDEKALPPSAVRGRDLFVGKATCNVCHSGPRFTDVQFHNIGIGQKKKKPDLGRFEVTKEDRDRGAYRTPALRNLRDTAPYMHDGSLKTLREVVDFYDKGGEDNEWLDPDMQPLELTEKEKADLLAFLESLQAETLVVNAGELPK